MGGQACHTRVDSNIEFKVGLKVSPTLLRLMGLAFDVVVMQETKESEARMTVETMLKVQREMAALYEKYLEEYVEGRVAKESAAPENESEALTCWIETWLEAGKADVSRPPAFLIGDGGTGKTSAAVALLCRLAKHKHTSASHQSDHAALAGKGQPVVPVFVSLPAFGLFLQGDVAADKDGLQEYMQQLMGLDEAGLKELQERYDVVLLLDSLDEMADGIIKEDKRFLQRFPSAAEHCSAVLTVRGEWLKAQQGSPADLCDGATEVRFLQQFSQEDALGYIAKRIEVPIPLPLPLFALNLL